MIEYVGWIGSMLFALCGVPQAIQSYKQKHSDGLSSVFLLMWFLGEVLSFAYAITKDDVLPIITNYVLNFSLLLVIIWYRLFPQRKEVKQMNFWSIILGWLSLIGERKGDYLDEYDMYEIAPSHREDLANILHTTVVVAFCQLFGADPEIVSDEEEFELDDLERIELIMEIEDILEIELPDEVVDVHPMTIANVVAAVEPHYLKML